MLPRFQEPESPPPWRWPVLVRCPRCARLAVVAHDPSGETVRRTCSACALVDEWDGSAIFVSRDGSGAMQLPRGKGGNYWLDPDTGRTWSHGLRWPEARDEFFGTDLWLQKDCCGGHVFWARNVEHLDYLEAFIAAGLREGLPHLRWQPVFSKLPTWMKLAKHRAELLRTIGRLRMSLP